MADIIPASAVHSTSLGTDEADVWSSWGRDRVGNIFRRSRRTNHCATGEELHVRNCLVAKPTPRGYFCRN
jgi:hypothetical protein